MLIPISYGQAGEAQAQDQTSQDGRGDRSIAEALCLAATIYGGGLGVEKER